MIKRLTPLVCLLALAVPVGAEEQPAASQLDPQLHALLKDVINKGADLFNSGNHAGCYYFYRGSLMTIKPLLGTHADLQKGIDAALVEVEAIPEMEKRAWAFRRVLDGVRAGLKSREDKPAEVKPEAALWQRLGGEARMTQVVNDWFDIALDNPKVNVTRDGKITLDADQTAAFKKHVLAFLSSVSGGPGTYAGKSMKEAHKNLAITGAEFDAAVADLKRALEKNGVPQAEADALAALLAKTRADIVEKP